MFSAMSCSPQVMNRFTPSMCQVPSGCAMALVRPAPTSEPASGSVSTIVEAQPRSTAIWANRFCSGVPTHHSTCAIDGPLAYIQIAGLAPSTSSAMAQCRERGAPMPPRPGGRSSRHHCPSVYAR